MRLLQRLPMRSMPSRLLSRRSRREAGFNLVEVMLASVLLGIVCLSIMGMFIYGGQTVQSGKLMTKATSIGSDVLEQVSKLSFNQTYQMLKTTGAVPADSHYVYYSIVPRPAPVAPAVACIYPHPEPAYQAMLADWKAQAETLPRGQIIISVRGLSSLGDPPTLATFTNARVLQVVVTIKWTERKRTRTAVFETLKS